MQIKAYESSYVAGEYIIIHQYNRFFDHVSQMLIEHFDVPEMKDTLFLLTSTKNITVKEFRDWHPNKKIIIYQLEQLCDNNNIIDINRLIDNMEGADEIWDYDPLNVAYLQMYKNIQVTKVVPMLFTKKLLLKESEIHNPDFDVIFYGMLNERRFRIIEHLQYHCYGQLKIGWIYGDHQIEKYIKNTKVVLNLHFLDPWHRQEQVRMFYPVINGKTVISEPSQVNNMQDYIIESSIDSLPDKLKEICNSDQWITFGFEAQEKFKKATEKWRQDHFLQIIS